MVTSNKKRRQLQKPRGNDSSKQQQQQQGSTNKKSKTTCNTETVGDRDINDEKMARLDPKIRGIHADAIQVNRAPTSASTCVDCGHKIKAHSPRWGIKYAGNPLPEPVIPLYGSHPMVMWCHAGCGLLAFIDMKAASSTDTLSATARTCHACEDTPSSVGLRLLCGGSSKGNKIRQHAFHLECWKKAIMEGCDASDDEECRKALLLDIKPQDIVGRSTAHGIGWNNLTEEQKNYVLETLRAN